MKKRKSKEMMTMPDERIVGKIYFLRGKKVMFDRDLAVLYGVKTGNLNKAVKRNIDRFPEDFMFQLTKDEAALFLRFQFGTLKENLKSQFVTLKRGRGEHRKYLPYVFTEQGVAMLSSVLNSDRAIQVNIQIMRTFTKLREMLAGHKELLEKLEKMERKYDRRFKVVFDVIKKLLQNDRKDKTTEIGFRGK